MAICRQCEEEMMDVSTCGMDEIKIGGIWYKRNNNYYDNNKRCHDCNIVNGNGNFHHFGCDIERCPKCGNQLISCKCHVYDLRKSINIMKMSLKEVDDLFGKGEISQEKVAEFVKAWNEEGGHFSEAYVGMNYIGLRQKREKS